jgi:hypothetical protein
MLTGRKTVATDETPAQTSVSVWRAVALSLLSVGGVVWIVNGF